MVGKCYVRSNDLTYDENDLWQSDSYEVCNPNSDMQSEGMCNMGISAGMTDNDVYIGSPGSFLWQGELCGAQVRCLSQGCPLNFALFLKETSM